MRTIGIIAIVLITVSSLCACSNTSTNSKMLTLPPATTEKQISTIPCEKAKDHIGEKTTVYRVVASTNYATGTKGKPTFLNLGKSYPNQIFTVVIWDSYRKNFSKSPESYYRGKTIYVSGLIINYQGVPEIEVTSPSQIREQ